MGALPCPAHIEHHQGLSSFGTRRVLRQSVACGAHRSRRRSLWAGASPGAPKYDEGALSCSFQLGSASLHVSEVRGSRHATPRAPPTGGCIELPKTLALTEEQDQRAARATSQLLNAISRCAAGSPLARLLTGPHGAASATGAGSHSSSAGAPTPTPRPDIAAAAALLPSLTWRWVSVADLEGGWVDRGVAHLLREALLVQKAASDVNASVSELVGWCMDNCSAPAAALAALWGQQQGAALPARSRSFYGLLLQRLDGGGASSAVAAAAGRQPHEHQQERSSAEAYGLSPALVFCSSVARTALSTSSRRGGRSSSSEEDGDAHDDRSHPHTQQLLEQDGSEPLVGAAASPSSNGKRSAAGPSAGADVILVGELPGDVLLDESVGNVRRQQPHANGSGAKHNGVNGSGKSGSGGAKVAHAHVNGSAADTDPGQAALGVKGSAESPLEQPAPAAKRSAAGKASRPAALLLKRPSRSAAPPAPTLPDGAEADGFASDGSGLPGHGQQQLSAIAAAAAASSLLAGPAAPMSFLETLSDDDDEARRAASLLNGAGMSDPASASSTSTSSNSGTSNLVGRVFVPMRLVSVSRFPLRDALGRPLPDGLAVPPTGPIVLSNDARVFPGTEGLLSDYATPAGDKLAVRLEYITDRSYAYGDVALQLFNISRVTRKRTDNCQMLVNGKPVNVGDPGVPLVPGDEIRFGASAAFAFRLEALPEAPSGLEAAVQQLQLHADSSSSNGNGSGSSSSSGLPQVSEEEVAAAAADMASLSNMSRRDPPRAEALLRRLLAARPGDAALWLIWAQMAARVEGPGPGQAKARMLFRAAADAARRMPVLPPPPLALQMAARRATGAGRRRRRGASTTASMDGDDGALSVADGSSSADAAIDPASGASPSAAAGPPAPSARPRHNWLLVQALGNWGKHEWRLRMYGSARHLFRAAADEAARHSGGLAAGGGGAVMHYWGSRELEAGNVRNARIVAAEALRKCPADVALYVLAASVELEASNLELAKGYCQRAYALDRTDKQLFLIWPRVEAGLGDRDKARLLFERALDAHPLNTKIINMYARFEAEEGSYREAAELYDRALQIDPLSPGPGVHNRADWASMETDLGNTGLARQLLEEGLEAHPNSAALLVVYSKLQRLEGRYQEALAAVRRAQAVAGAFNAAVMNERAQVLRALGERELAANLSRHVSAVKQLNRMKQQGYWGSEAWRAFVEATRTPEQRTLVAAARAHRLQLGWAPAVRGAKPGPPPGVVAGDGRRPAAPETQQWMALEELRRQRAEARRLTAQRTARLRAEEAAAAAGGGEAGAAAAAAALAMGSTGSMGSMDGDEGYDDEIQDPVMYGADLGSGPLPRRRLEDQDADYYEEPESMALPPLDAVRRPMPDADDM
uniref:PsbD mRNA maturation factor Nac2, chloroplastic n=1 Tax=Chlamydomonas reinhardtii TaxID=3055 RepID=NAC2_CHLRE|nr:RecName: Full=PsbD mRNA maturation factor Nac2, chloroplastic; Flags: Precursor [Chlamydomonas reinhardtii]CAB96529.1 chloroplast TPR protein [Chlamydomonas reinhardtii]